MSTVQIRITLESPYRKNFRGEELPLILRHGTSEARLIAQNSAANVAGADVNMDDMVDAGSYREHVPRAIRKMRPGKPITWELKHSDKAMRSINVPVDAARLWFGDWRYPKEAEPDTPYEMTFAFERQRVAARWGWWKMPQRAPDGRTYYGPGEMPDMSKIGPPTVPQVLLEDVDERGNVGSRLKMRPWQHFGWEDDVITPLDARQASTGPVKTFTEDELRAMLAAIEASKKAAS